MTGLIKRVNIFAHCVFSSKRKMVSNIKSNLLPEITFSSVQYLGCYLSLFCKVPQHVVLQRLKKTNK